MKKKIKIIAGIAGFVLVLIAGSVIGFQRWHTVQMRNLEEQLDQAHEQERLLEERISAIKGDYTSLSDDNQTLLDKTKELEKKIEDLTTVEEAVFDAGAVMEEIQSINELAAIEYLYTNVGTLDASRNFKYIDLKVPFSDKTVIITMDGVIKAGIDLSKVQIKCNEQKKLITVTVPASQILSNELKEDSLMVYEEKNSVWNQITLDDSSKLRKQIKEKAEQNAEQNKILKMADDRAAQLIRSIIEASPNVKENYEIRFETK